MHHLVVPLVMFAQFVDLCVAIVARRHTIGGARGLDLIVFEPAVFQPRLFVAGLEKTAAPTAAVVVGAVGHHIDEVFLAHHGLNYEAQILGNGITVGFADDLTGILGGKLDFEVFIPIGIDLQFALANPFRVIFVDVLDFKVVGNVKFFQSCQD